MAYKVAKYSQIGKKKLPLWCMLGFVLKHPIKSVLCALILLTIFLFPGEIFLRSISWGLKSYCYIALNSQLRLEKMRWQDGAFKIEKGELAKSGYFAVEISDFSLRPFFQSKKLVGELDIGRVYVTQTQRSEFSFPKLPLFSRLDTAIHSGHLTISNGSEVDWKVEGVITPRELVQTVTVQLDRRSEPLVARYVQTRDGKAEITTRFTEHLLPSVNPWVHYYGHLYLDTPNIDWEFASGTVSGEMCLSWQGSEIDQIVGDLTLEHASATNFSLGLSGSVEELSVRLDLAAAKCDEWDGEIVLHNGTLSFKERHRELWQGMWDLKIHHTELLVKDGQVESSIFDANLLGMKGELALDWLSKDVLMHLTFSGNSQEMIPFLPESIQSAFSEGFSNDFFHIDALVKRGQAGLELEGKVLIKDKEQQTLWFGCSFGDCLPASLPEVALDDSFNLNFGLSSSESEEFTPQVLGFSAEVNGQRPFAKQKSTRDASKVPEGEGEKPEVQVFMGGLKEQFCLSRRRHGWFRGEDFPIEKFLSPFLFNRIRMEACGSADFEATFDDRFLIIYYKGKDFHLESPHLSLSADHIGKKAGEVTAVHYIDLDTFEHLGFLPLSGATYCQKNRDLTFTDAQAVIFFENAKIRIEQIEMQREELFFKGEVGLEIRSKEEVDLTISTQRVSGPAAQAQEFISHFIASSVWDLPLSGQISSGPDDLFFHFVFQPKAKLVEGRVRGKVKADYLGPPFVLSEMVGDFDYDFESNRVIFADWEGSFSQNDQLYRWVVPQATISDFPHQQIALAMEVWREGEKFLTLDGRTKRDSDGRAVFIDSDLFSVRGHQEGTHLVVDHFHSEKFTGQGELEWQEKICKIEDLQLTAVDLGHFSLEGELDRQSWIFRGQVNDFELQLDGLSALPAVAQGLSVWDPHGKVRGRGELSFRLLDKQLEAETMADFTQLEFGGVSFGDGKELKCRYGSEDGFTVEGLEVNIPGGERYKLGQFHYHFESQKILFDSFDFSLPSEKLAWVAEVADQFFPGKIHPSVVTHLLALKKNESLDGEISVELFPGQVWIQLNLKDGCYNLAGKQHDLKNISLVYDPFELALRSQYLFQDQYYWIDMMVDSRSLSHGEMAIGDGYEKIVVSGERNNEFSWSVNRIEGGCSGIEVDLEADEMNDFSDTLKLSGKIGFDVDRVSKLLPPEYQKIIAKLAMGKGYGLSGDFVCPKKDLTDWQFCGNLTGEDFVLMSTRLSSLFCHADYRKESLELTDLSIEDWSGRLALERLSLDKVDNQWQLDIPQIQLGNLRPARLRTSHFQKGKKGKFLKSLIISSGEIHQLKGTIGEESSFAGSGALQFTNLPKKNFLSPVLYLPTEITARIGLDLSLLVPARGTISYEIQDGRIYLTKFKEMYSDGKHSRFYLAEGYPAYVDFAGNLNMKVKMKQYNLLMKLAEFFTVTVKGTLFKPTYTLTNQDDA